MKRGSAALIIPFSITIVKFDQYFQLKKLIIKDSSLPPQDFGELAITVGRTLAEELHFVSCNLDSDKLLTFGKTCNDESIQVRMYENVELCLKNIN